MPPVVIYVLALLLGAAIAGVAWRFWPWRQRPRLPEPATCSLDDPALTCRLVSPEEGARVVGERTLWWANGPAMERSALIYPYGYLAGFIQLEHPEEQVLGEIRRLLATTRADYVLVHPKAYYPIGVALRPDDEDERRRLAREQLATLAERAGLQVLWVPFGHNGDIDDVVMAIQGGALETIREQPLDPA